MDDSAREFEKGEATGPSKGRLEAFSDGVFAVAITLLVLDIALDHHAERGRLWHELGTLSFHYAAYAISFLTIGVMWVNHHNLMTFVNTVDHALMYRNLLLLGIVCFLPFPTAILSEYVHGEGASNMRAAVSFYGLAMFALALAFTALWLHVYRCPAIRPQWARQDVIALHMKRSAIATISYLPAVALSFVAPQVSLVIYALFVFAFATVQLRGEPAASPA